MENVRVYGTNGVGINIVKSLEATGDGIKAN